MASSNCLSKRFVLAVTQTPSARTISICCPNRLPAPKTWIRTITSSPKRHAPHKPLVSFGKDNDDLLAPYAQKDPNTRKRRTAEGPQPDTNDDYEIDQFVDRSKPISQEVERPSDSHNSSSTGSDGPNVKRETSIRPSSKRRQDKNGTTHHSTDRETRPRSGKSLRFLPDIATREFRTRRPRYTTNDRDAARTTLGRPLARKVTEDAEKWTVQKNALKEKFQEGWQPRKKLSPDAQEGIRGLHEQDPITYSTDILSKQFKQSPEAIRRILRSKWQSQQSPEKMQERRERWARRHDRIWDAKAEIGQRPQRRKDKEVEDPDKFEQDLERKRILGEL